ncbi:hypothetical protein OUZ56_020380 [Daphnia magna]|uniref:Uncharacterized protein n=1 Tax=Daphnia magna TaxID=35525 RepID=A0ABQ9ZEB5_9CRUS|nr:hypothetical protein OUZ56_020380 [Daphnia magna]
MYHGDCIYIAEEKSHFINKMSQPQNTPIVVNALDVDIEDNQRTATHLMDSWPDMPPDLQWVPKVSVRLRGSVGKTRFSKRSHK